MTPLVPTAVPASAGTVTVEVKTLAGIMLAEGTLVEELSAGVVLRDARWYATGEKIQDKDTGDTVFLCGKILSAEDEATWLARAV